MKNSPISTEDTSCRKYAAVLGTQMAYVDVGHGEPIVFLHGNPTPSYLLRKNSFATECCRWGDASHPTILAWAFRLQHQMVAIGSSIISVISSLVRGAWNPENVILVVHDWGSALGFSWAQRHPDSVKAIVYMEGIVRSFKSWNEWPESTRAFFQAQRTEAGEDLILEKNLFIEYLLPLRNISAEAMDVYRRYFRVPGPARQPILSWTRDLPISGEPEDVVRSSTHTRRGSRTRQFRSYSSMQIRRLPHRSTKRVLPLVAKPDNG